MRQTGAARAWSLALTLLVLAPVLLARGFVLVGDMVFVPDQPWKDAWLGVDGSVPRAVPSDAWVSVMAHVLPGDILQKLVLVGILLGAGLGMASLAARHGTRGQLVATAVYVWNPFVYERLAIGHWAFLCGYAVLPWVVLAAERVRDRREGGYPRLVATLGVAAFASPSGGLLAAGLALAVLVMRPRSRALLATTGLAVALNLPWLLPGLLFPGGIPADVAGVEAFAARADTPLGTLGSLMSLGGLWKTSVAAPGRETLFLAVAGLLVVLAGTVGVVRSGLRGDRTARALTGAAALGLLLAWLPSTTWGQPLFEWLAGAVPGAGLLRDSQKFVAPLALAAAAGAGALVADVEGRIRARGSSLLGLSLLPVIPLVILPGLAWGEFGRLEPVGYPTEWTTVATRLDEDGAAGQRVVVLPFELYRRYPWNGDRAVLDPSPRFFPGDVVTNDLLRVGGNATVAGEDPVAARVSDALTGDPALVGDRLDRLGVSWLLVDKGASGAGAAPILPGRVVHDGPGLQLRYLGDHEPRPAPSWRVPVLLVDGLVLVLVAVICGTAVARRIRVILVGEGDAA